MIKELCVDDFGNQWYVADKYPLKPTRFGSWVYTHTYTEKGVVSDWTQTCYVEAMIWYEIATPEQIKALGFKPRWEHTPNWL